MSKPAASARLAAARESVDQIRRSRSPVSARGDGIAFALRQRARADRRPGRLGAVMARSGCAPSQGRAALARRPAWPSWMPRRHAVARDTERRCAPSPRSGRRSTDPGAAMGDAAVAGDAGRLDEGRAEAAEREPGVMLVVPVLHRALDRLILAHRRDDDAVAQRRGRAGASGVNSSGVDTSVYSAACSRLPSSSSISASSSLMTCFSFLTRALAFLAELLEGGERRRARRRPDSRPRRTAPWNSTGGRRSDGPRWMIAYIWLIRRSIFLASSSGPRRMIVADAVRGARDVVAVGVHVADRTVEIGFDDALAGEHVHHALGLLDDVVDPRHLLARLLDVADLLESPRSAAPTSFADMSTLEVNGLL